ncbi:MAG: hypothetical protein R2823_10885 [Acidimicrobiia bacterium]
MFAVRYPALLLATAALAAALIIANFGWFARRDLADSQRFSEIAVGALAEPSSTEAIASITVERFSDGRPVLIAVSPLLESALVGILERPRLEPMLVSVAAQLHAALFDGQAEGIVVDLTGVEDLIMGPLERFAPEFAATIESSFFAEIVIVEPGSLPELSPYASIARRILWGAILLAVILSVLIVLLARRAATATMMIGGAVAFAGLVTSFVLPGGRRVVIEAVSDDRVEVIVTNIFHDLAAGLRAQSRLLLMIGLAVVIVGLVLRIASSPSRLATSD